jgi:hypothetical protein
MLAALAYVERAASKVLLQRHKTGLDPSQQIAGIFLNCFMFLTPRRGVLGPLGVQWRDDAPQALARPE